MFEIEFITRPVININMARTIRLDDIMTDGYFVITSLSIHGLMTWNQPLIIEVIARKADTREKEVIGFTKKNSLIIINNILIPSRNVDNLLTEP